VDHLSRLNSTEADLLAHSPTIATLLPGAAFYQRNLSYPPARMLIDRGAAVALGTDYNPETSPSNNMQVVVALACRQMGMTPAEAISAATINGAHALGQADRVGSLERGKSADLVMLRVSDYREIPYQLGVNLVETTMKKGHVVYQASEVQWPRG
jgi:imidazolonepropionase